MIRLLKTIKMINFKKEWRWMEDDKWDHYSGLPSPKAYEDHPYYDSKSKKQSYTIAVVSMMAAIVLVIGLAIYEYIQI